MSSCSNYGAANRLCGGNAVLGVALCYYWVSPEIAKTHKPKPGKNLGGACTASVIVAHIPWKYFIVQKHKCLFGELCLELSYDLHDRTGVSMETSEAAADAACCDLGLPIIYMASAKIP